MAAFTINFDGYQKEDLEEAYAVMCYGFLALGLKKVSVLIMDPDIPENTDNMGKRYDETYTPTLEEFMNEYRARRSGIICIGTLDEADTQHMCIDVIPAFAFKYDVPAIIFQDYDTLDDEEKQLFIDIIYQKCCQLYQK